MKKIKLADNVVRSCLVNENGSPYCSIPISVAKNSNVEGLFDKLATIDPNLIVYNKTTSPYYTIFVNVSVDIELDAEEADSQDGDNMYEIMNGLPQEIILSKMPCFVPKHHWKIV